jgi:hypothetical protein
LQPATAPVLLNADDAVLNDGKRRLSDEPAFMTYRGCLHQGADGDARYGLRKSRRFIDSSNAQAVSFWRRCRKVRAKAQGFVSYC